MELSFKVAPKFIHSDRFGRRQSLPNIFATVDIGSFFFQKRRCESDRKGQGRFLRVFLRCASSSQEKMWDTVIQLQFCPIICITWCVVKQIDLEVRIYSIQIELHKCFRPGDIILGKVQSIGDAQSYIVTTAENELGVVVATSEAGTKTKTWEFAFVTFAQIWMRCGVMSKCNM